jgi:hypothetical protein
MVYRISKVFSGIETLKRTLMDIEQSLSTLKLAQVRQQMTELEGPNFNYTPLFSEHNREKVRDNSFKSLFERSVGNPGSRLYLLNIFFTGVSVDYFD